jgi:hypothetical protein
VSAEPDAVTMLDRERLKLNLLRATIALCLRHEQIAELTRRARAVPMCETPTTEADPDVVPRYDYCTDRMTSSGGIDHPPESIRWWEMNERQLATVCTACRSRVVIWEERAKLKRGIGGAKRALLVAYRAYVGGAR